jgi:hypothetical protein
VLCHICHQEISLSKTRDHVNSHCLDPSDKEDFIIVYRKVTGVVTFESSFRPSKGRLKDIAEKGSDLLANATLEDLKDWSEW